MEDVAPRFELDLHLEVSVGSTTALGRSMDLSISGIGAYIPRELEIGQFVSLYMRLPFKRADLTCGAIVRNRSGFRYGLEFSSVRMAQQEFINEICNTLDNLSSLKNLEFDS